MTLPSLPAAGGAMDAHRVYIPLQSGQLVALDRATGAALWTSAVATTWPPLAVNDTVVVAAPDALLALDGPTGDVVWRTPLDRPAATPPSRGDQLLFLASDRLVSAFGLSDGSLAWQQAIAAAPVSPVMARGDVAVLSLADGQVLAFDPADGRPSWSQVLPGMPSTPALARDRVFVGSTDNHLYALGDRTGALQWRWRAGGDVVGVAAAGEAVFFIALDNLVRSLNRGNGNQRWKAETAGRPAPPLSVIGNRVLVSDLSPVLVVLEADTGRVERTYPAPGDLAGAPLIDPEGQDAGVGVVLVTLDGEVAGLQRAVDRPPGDEPTAEDTEAVRSDAP